MIRMVMLMMMILSAVSLSLAQDDLPSEARAVLTTEGARLYRLYVPDDLPDSVPLVLVLHPRGGDGIGMEDFSGFDAVAEREKFLVAYPDALGGEWNFVRDIPGYEMPQDDIAYLLAVVDDVATDYTVDPARIYIAGFSNGGFMAQRVACQSPERFAAFASVAAAGFGGMLEVCLEPETETAPVLLMHGTDDENVPWEGLSVTRGARTVWVLYPVPETLSYWAEFNGCQPEMETADLPQTGNSPGTQARVMLVDCPENATVMLYAILGGGHTWPGRESGVPPEIAGLTSMDVDAAEAIWTFFSRHTREVRSTED